ncbi:MAG: PQQ-binding-like beta-propeller repeat protein [Actinomycetota bacterium]
MRFTALVLGVGLLAVIAPAGAVSAAPDPSCPLSGTDDKCETWTASFDHSLQNGPVALDEAAAMAVSPDGTRVFVTGNTAPSGATDHDMATVAYDAATGAAAWQDLYSGPGGGDDVAEAVAVSPDGEHIFVAGMEDDVVAPGGWSTSSFSLRSLDAATGVPRWTATYDGSDVDGPYGFNHIYAMALSPDGSRVYVSGTSLGGGTDHDYSTIAYDASTGAFVWQARYDQDKGVDRPVALAVSPDGARVFVTGFSWRRLPGGGISDPDVVTIAYDGATGDARWHDQFDGGAHRSDVPTALGVSPDGTRLYVTLDAAGPGTLGSPFGDLVTLSYDTATGARVWQARLTTPGVANTGSDLAVSPDGSRLYVVGKTDTYTTTTSLVTRSADYVAVAYDAATGQQLWLNRYGFPQSSEEAAFGVAVTPDGQHVLVTGGSSDLYDTAVDNVATLSYTASGAQEWVARYRNLASLDLDDPVGIVLDPAGRRAFVAGTFDVRPDAAHRSAAQYDFGTLAYTL